MKVSEFFSTILRPNQSSRREFLHGKIFSDENDEIRQLSKGFFVEELRPGYVLAELGKGKLTLRYKPLGADQHGVYSAVWS